MRTPVHRKRRMSAWTRGGIARAAAFVLATLAAACERTPRSSADSPDSAQIVLQGTDVHVFATSESIAVVEDLELLPDGTVWVLNSVEPYFVGFGPDGQVLRMHGRRGGGPEEFGTPASFVVGGMDGEAWVFDRRRHAMIQVSRPDAARSEILLPREAIPPGSVAGGMEFLSNVWVKTAGLGDELIVPRGAAQPESISDFWLAAWSADLVALDVGTDSVRSVVSLGSVVGDPSPHFELLDDGFPPFPLWYRLWAVCSDREIRVYDRLRHELRGFTADGTESEASALPPPRYIEVTPRQFARVTFDLAVIERAAEVTPGIAEMSSVDSARIINGLIARLDATPRQLANLLPRYVDFRCTGDGTRWIQPLDIEVGGLSGGPVWLRMAPDGQVNEIRLPERFDPYRFTSERIWGVQRDEFDVA